MKQLQTQLGRALGMVVLLLANSIHAQTSGYNSSTNTLASIEELEEKAKATIITNFPPDTDTSPVKMTVDRLACRLDFYRSLDDGPPPVCLVYVYYQDAITNRVPKREWIYGLNLPQTNLFQIELYDSAGKLVPKTSSGKAFDEPLTYETIYEWHIKKLHDYSGDRDPFFSIMPPGAGYPGETLGFISIPKTFEVREPGEYTLHVKMRYIQRHLDSFGKWSFPIIWLPEATAKVQIRSEDIVSTNAIPSVQINSRAN